METKRNPSVPFGLNSVFALVMVALVSDAHDCDRDCIKGEKPMTCHYNFTLEKYVTLNKNCLNCPLNITDCYRVGCIPTNGVRRLITVVNRSLPGTPIVVCKGDKVIVDVVNHAGIDSSTIHWHGVKQVGTPYMDGVPFVTQCPIYPFNSFQYSYTAAEAGTIFYHSHMGFQRTDGLSGMLVVRQPKEDDPNAAYYDFDLTDHQILVTDWMNKSGEEMYFDFFFTGTTYHPFLTTILVNGKARLEAYVNTTSGTIHYTPYSCFTVKSGSRYRFRISSNANWICPIEVSVDNHDLLVVGTDMDSVEPMAVKAFVINPGERFDFVINANQSIATYWMNFRGLLLCKLGGAVGRAILKYETARNVEPSETAGDSSTSSQLILNPVNDPFVNKTHISLRHLKSFSPPDPSLKEIPDVKYYIPFNFYPNIDPEYYDPVYYEFHTMLPMVNHTAWAFPPSPLLTQFDDIPKDLLCTDMKRPMKNNQAINCTEEFCKCTYYIKVGLGQVVELILIDEGLPLWQTVANHPWHLHGHAFRVVAERFLYSNNTVAGVKALDDAGGIVRNLDRPVAKDTVSVPLSGYSVLRFHATNPGFWAFHCHVELHAEAGMFIVFQVGEQSDFPKAPADFPRCSNFPSPQRKA